MWYLDYFGKFYRCEVPGIHLDINNEDMLNLVIPFLDI